MDAWLSHHENSVGVWWYNAVFIGGAAIFLVLPGYRWVIGAGISFRGAWFLQSAERAKSWECIKRIFVWFVSTGACGTLWSLILRFAIPASRTG